MAAIMAQIEHSDWSIVEKKEGNEYIARDVLQRFCPWKFTHMALEHDQSQLQKRLVDQWREQAGKSRAECSKIYLELAQQWKYYGATLFKAEVRYQHLFAPQTHNPFFPVYHQPYNPDTSQIRDFQE